MANRTRGLVGPLKPLGQMNCNLVGNILGRPSQKIAQFVPIRKQTWPPQAFLVSGWSSSKNLLLCNYLKKVNTEPSIGSSRQVVTEKKIFRTRPTRNKKCLWRPCLFTNRDKLSNLYMVATGNSCF
jgi:hypothetical protein